MTLVDAVRRTTPIHSTPDSHDVIGHEHAQVASLEATPLRDTELAQRMRAAASAVIAEQPGAHFPANAPQRARWTHEPEPARLGRVIGWAERDGVRDSDLSPAAAEQVRSVMRAAMSPEGYDVVLAARHSEEQRGADHPFYLRWLFDYDPTNYRVSIFGEPRLGDDWAMRIQGHHASITLSVAADGRVSARPVSLGSTTPSVTLPDGRAVEPLAGVAEAAARFSACLGEAQQAAARQAMNGVPMRSQIVSTLKGEPVTLESVRAPGLRAADLDHAQRRQLEGLLSRYREQFAPAVARQMARDMGRLDDMTVVMSGDPAMREPFYLRVQGERFMLELMSSEGKASHRHAAYLVD